MGTKKQAGYWPVWENLEKELEPIIKKLGRFPSHDDLTELERKDLSSAIFRHYGGINVVRKRMGYDPLRRPNGSWPVWENLEKELEPIIKKLGRFPSHDDLTKLERTDLSNAIFRHHGGFPAVREKMGYGRLKRPSGYGAVWKNVERELTDITLKLGHFPRERELIDLNESGLYSAIVKFHGGLTAVREKMGHKEMNAPRGYWKVFINVKKELESITHQFGHFPSGKELVRLNKSGLSSALQQHHGGLKVVREKMGYGTTRKPQGYWPVWENAKKELTDITLKLGHFPSRSELRDLKKGGLAVAISKYHGGMTVVREKMGYKCETTPPGYWPVWGNAEKALREVIHDLGHFPSHSELGDLKLRGLSNAINKYHGGILEVKKKMGLLPLNELENSDLESLLEEYVSS